MLHLSAQLPRSRGLANLNAASRWYSFFSRWWQIGRIHQPQKCQKKHRKRVTNLTWHHSEAVKINLLVSEVLFLFPQTLMAFQRLVGASLLVDGDAGSAEILTAPRRIHVFIGFNWAWIWILSFQIQRHITTSSILHGSMANSREYIFLLDTVRSPSNIAKGTGANSDSSAMTWTKNQWHNEVTELDQHPTSKCLWRPTTLRGFHYHDVTWHSYEAPKQLIFQRFDADCMMFIFGSLCSAMEMNHGMWCSWASDSKC